LRLRRCPGYDSIGLRKPDDAKWLTTAASNSDVDAEAREALIDEACVRRRPPQ
jgi:hypothetical protein